MFFTSLITPMILLVLYSTFLGNVYRDAFVSAIPPLVQIPNKVINATVGGQLISSLLAISCVTVTFCCNMLMVQDKVTGARRDLIGKRISAELEQIMEDRAIYRAQGSERSVYVTDTLDRCCAAIAAPIISEGDALGLVLFVENEGENHVGETEYKLAQTIASFLGRHMES